MWDPGQYQYQPSRKDDFVHRSNYRTRRTYVYAPRAARIRMVFLLICIVLLAYSTIRLTQYARDAHSTVATSNELRTIYYTEGNAIVVPTPTPLPAQTAEPINAQEPLITQEPIITQYPITRPSAASTPLPILKSKPYPAHSQATMSQRFVQLRQQNSDIIGWLRIDNSLDEAVVQRDNTYYLDRDCLGSPNVNGAIFLDETTDLTTRPYTLLLYGHNMKSGLMFGRLHNYETLSYYKRNAFISFNTVYEEGLYVVLGASTISLTTTSDRFVDLMDLSSMDSLRRAAALQALMAHSPLNTPIDIRLDDQLLLLITCVDKDDERRVVYARRLRDGETQEAMQLLVNQTTAFSP